MKTVYLADYRRMSIRRVCIDKATSRNVYSGGIKYSRRVRTAEDDYQIADSFDDAKGLLQEHCIKALKDIKEAEAKALRTLDEVTGMRQERVPVITMDEAVSL